MFRRPRSARRGHRSRPRLESLERRSLLATFTVTSNADSGAGTLRDAITQANADTMAGARHDRLQHRLGRASDDLGQNGSCPDIQPFEILIDGTSQPGYFDNAADRAERLGDQAESMGSSITECREQHNPRPYLRRFHSGIRSSPAPATGILLCWRGDGGDLIRGLFPRARTLEGRRPRPTAVGIAVHSNNDTIGGTSASDRNLISGQCDGQGVLVGGQVRGAVSGRRDSRSMAP